VDSLDDRGLDVASVSMAAQDLTKESYDTPLPPYRTRRKSHDLGRGHRSTTTYFVGLGQHLKNGRRRAHLEAGIRQGAGSAIGSLA
jgi:hypothetical protein